jgi:tetratricopeptide (TPR) repeat protein
VACVEDCDAVLAALDDAAGGNAAAGAGGAGTPAPQQRLRAVARRLAALTMDGKYAAALEDARRLAAAVGDPDVEAAAGRLESVAAAAAAKERGDRAAGADADAALAAYGEALAAEPQFALVRLNRSALYMRLNRPADAAEDCRAVLALLDAAPAGPPVADAALVPVPPKGSALHVQAATRATARLEECERRLGLRDGGGDGAAPGAAGGGGGGGGA